MIKQIVVKNFKKFRELDFECNKEKNILIGENSSGKSSLIQGISLVLSGSFSQVESIGVINLFNIDCVTEFLRVKDINKLPEVFIELYFDDDLFSNTTDFYLEGIHNSKKIAAFGLKLHISPKEDSIGDIQTALIDNKWSIFPFEFYKVEFITFSGKPYTSYTKPFKFSHSIINTSLIDTKSELQKRVDEIYSDNIELSNRHIINHRFREMSKNFLDDLASSNLLKVTGEYTLEFDNSSEDAFKSKITASKNNIDIRQIGQGEKVMLSVENAYNRLSEKVKIILIEEPENHLSHINMLKLLDVFYKKENMQVFIATHSNMITSRLGINNCLLFKEGCILPINNISDETVEFFAKSTNQNFLNYILSDKTILVEGNAEYILMEKFYEIEVGNKAYIDNVQIISVDGLSFKRYLEISKKFHNKKVVVITDNDGNYHDNIIDRYYEYDLNQNIQVYSDEDDDNYTFEVCLYNLNNDFLRENNLTKSSDLQGFMLSNKSESALRILNILNYSSDGFIIPEYIKNAISWVREN